jgi:hypothetical protein
MFLFLVKKLSALNWTRRLITMQTSALHLSLSLEPHKYIRHHPILYLRSTSVSLFYLGIDPRNYNFPSCFFTKTQHALLFPTACAEGLNLFILDLSIWKIFGKGKKFTTLLTVQFSQFLFYSLSLAVAFSSAFYSRTPVAYIVPFHFPLFTRFKKPVPIRGLV